MDNKIIISKIKKLFALGTSSNPEEAQSAINKAHELLVKHNMSMEDVKTEDKIFITQPIDDAKKNKPSWQSDLFSIISEHFMVDLIGTGGRSGNRSKFWSFVGTEINVKLASFAIDFLLYEYKRLANEYMKEYKKDPDLIMLLTGNKISYAIKARNSFYFGLNLGFAKSLAKQTIKEQEAGLVVVKDKDLTQYTNDLCNGKKMNQSRNAEIDGDAYQSGKNVGEDLKLIGAVEDRAPKNNGLVLA